MPVGRPHTRSDRQVSLEKLWNKLLRNTYALVDYDLIMHGIEKITPAEKTKLLAACKMAIDAVGKAKYRRK